MKTKPFWDSFAQHSDRTTTLRTILAYIFQAKTYKTKAKHAAKHLRKHVKSTNGSLSEDVVGARQPIMIVREKL